MPVKTRAVTRALEGKSGPITPKKPKTKTTPAKPGGSVQKRKPGRRRRPSQDSDDDAGHRDASTQTSSLAEARFRRSMRRNVSTQTSSSIDASTGTETRRSDGTALARPRFRRGAGWVLRALGTICSGVLLNAAFFHFNPGNSAAQFCLWWQELHPDAQPSGKTQPARLTLTATDQCIPQYCPGTFSWHEIPKEPKYYKGLGLNTRATASEIRSACRKAKKRWHPDHSLQHGLEKEEANKITKTVVEACTVLQDEESKDAYDMYGAEKPERPRRAPPAWTNPNYFRDSKY